MAKLEQTLSGGFDENLRRIEEGLLRGGRTASLEDASDFSGQTARCAVRIFGRYSAWDGSRVGLTVTLFQADGGPVQLSAITAGGGGFVLKKGAAMDTVGEETFLDKLRRLL